MRRALPLVLLALAGVVVYLYLGRSDPEELAEPAEGSPDPPRKVGSSVLTDLMDLLPGELAEPSAEAPEGAVALDSRRSLLLLGHSGANEPAADSPPDTTMPRTTSPYTTLIYGSLSGGSLAIPKGART